MVGNVLGLQSSHIRSVLQVVPTMLSHVQLAHGQKHSDVVVPAGIYRQAVLRMLVPCLTCALYISYKQVCSSDCPIQCKFLRSNNNLLRVLSCVWQACLEAPCRLSLCQLANGEGATCA